MTKQDKQTIEEIEKKVREIVTGAVESQMDWESFYKGDSPEAVEEIMDLISTIRQEAVEEFVEFIHSEIPDLTNQDVVIVGNLAREWKKKYFEHLVSLKGE